MKNLKKVAAKGAAVILACTCIVTAAAVAQHFIRKEMKTAVFGAVPKVDGNLAEQIEVNLIDQIDDGTFPYMGERMDDITIVSAYLDGKPELTPVWFSKSLDAFTPAKTRFEIKSLDGREHDLCIKVQLFAVEDVAGDVAVDIADLTENACVGIKFDCGSYGGAEVLKFEQAFGVTPSVCEATKYISISAEEAAYIDFTGMHCGVADTTTPFKMVLEVLPAQGDT